MFAEKNLSFAINVSPEKNILLPPPPQPLTPPPVTQIFAARIQALPAQG
jgi:hypothetical protein